jgi:ABC-type transport system involved in multi-copper enzyme maturation permease subunit
MKAMIWKELRENFKWALLALLVLTIAEFYALSSSRSDTENLYNELTLCSSAFLEVTSFGCSAVGVALGVVQILPELRRDQWAALLHRPVPRSVIFFGKVVSGLILYGLAVIPPFLISVAYVLVPGQFPAPFVPGMMFPGFTDLFLGPLFYFASILLCLHRGRWFGSRGLIGLSLPALFLLSTAAAHPLYLSIPAALIFFAAAWGAILSSEVVKNRPRVSRFAFVMVMLAGAQSAWLLIVFGLQFLPSKSPPPATFTQFTITQDGQVFTATQKGDGSQVLTDGNGKLVTDEKYYSNNGYGNFLQILPFAALGPLNRRDSYLNSNPRNLRNYVEPIQAGYESKEYWYVLVGQKYFVGYDKLSRRCIGICDVDGFESATAVPKPFPLKVLTYDYWSGLPYHYWSGSQAYAIDFSARSMTPVFNSQNETIYGISNLIDMAHREKAPGFAVALDNGVQIFDAQAKPGANIPYSHDPGIWTDVWLANNPKLGRLYLQYTAAFSPFRPPLPTYLDEIDNQGNLVHEYTQPPANIIIQPPGWVERLSVLSLPFLPAFAVTGYSAIVDAPPSLNDTIGTVPFQHPRFRLETSDLVTVFIVGVLLAVITHMWARGTGLAARSTWLWTLFVFCFGLPGLLTFRLASDWPVRLRCPVCGKRRAVDKETCPSCLQRWPLPERNKTEIMDAEAVGRT